MPDNQPNSPGEACPITDACPIEQPGTGGEPRRSGELPPREESSPAGGPRLRRRLLTSGAAAAVIYAGCSFVAGLIFWLVTTFTGSYTHVARWGGAAWIFLLFMIVLMPIVIPRVKGRR